jgi:hypothetical protein
MLAAIDASGYAAYTRPGSYDTYAILPTDGGAEELPPSQYEQFVARVLESASTASTAAQRAAASAASTASNAAQAQTAAQRTSADSAHPDWLPDGRLRRSHRPAPTVPLHPAVQPVPRLLPHGQRSWCLPTVR